MKLFMLSLSALIISGFLSPLVATSYAEPEDMRVSSPNGKYVLKITAKTGEHELCEGDKVLWSFKRRVWHNDYFVSDDGKHVLWVNWPHVRDEFAHKSEAYAVYSAQGLLLRKHVNQVSKPRERKGDEVGPMGRSMRIWREGLGRDGERITIKVAGMEPVAIDLNSPMGED